MLLSAALTTDELLQAPPSLESSGKEGRAQLRQTYQRFISSNSDLLTLSNVLGHFFRETRSLRAGRFSMTGALKAAVKDFAASNCLRAKSLYDAVCFVMLVLKVCALIFDAAANDKLLRRLDDYANVKGADEQQVTEVLVTNSAERLARKTLVYDELNRPKVLFETVDFQRARLSRGSFVSRTAEFFVYKHAFEAEQ